MPRQGRRDNRSAEAEAWRKLYKTARWQEIRRAQLAAFPLCQTCMSRGHVTPASVCNHADKNSKATVEGFFAGPFSSECAPCHDSVIQRREKRGYVVGCGSDGRPNDPSHPWNKR